MPDKRQTSKQRRAARNRAYREAMMARRENAAVERAQSANPSESSGATTRDGRGGGARGPWGGGGRGGGARGPWGGGAPGPVIERQPGVRAPGDRALLVMLILAALGTIIAFVVALDTSRVAVAADGKALTSTGFVGVSREATAILRGTPPVDKTTSLFDVAPLQTVVFAVVPLVVAAGIFIVHRRRILARQLTIGLIALAVMSFVNPFSQLFLPALVALLVGWFQVRKVEMPARMGAQRPGGGRTTGRGGDVIDVEEVSGERGDGGEGDGTTPRPGDAARHDDDVLAELEEEIAREREEEDKRDGGSTKRDRPPDT